MVKDTLGKKLHQDRWIRSWGFHNKSSIGLTDQSV